MLELAAAFGRRQTVMEAVAVRCMARVLAATQPLRAAAASDFKSHGLHAAAIM